MRNDLLLLWLAAFPLMGSPGPATLSLAALGTAFGFRRSLAYLAGIVVGTTGVLLLVASGLTALVLAEPALLTGLAGLAAGYVVYLAWRIATAPVGRAGPATDRAPSFLPGLLLALANPKAFAAIGAVYSGRLLDADPLADALAKVAALAVVIVVANTAWLAFGASFARLLGHPRLGRLANLAFAAMLLASVAFALIQWR